MRDAGVDDREAGKMTATAAPGFLRVRNITGFQIGPSVHVCSG